MFWFMVLNIASTALCLWAVYEARTSIMVADELQSKTLRRVNDILEQCLELEEKLKNDKRP